MSVGGVRIEDDILITSKGYENLTMAPKGDAMLSIIRGENRDLSLAMRPTTALRAGTDDFPLFRAPGVPIETTPPGLRLTHQVPVLPAHSLQKRTDEANPRNLSSDFGRFMTTDERVQHWRRSFHRSSFPQVPSPDLQKPNTLCGSASRNNKHKYIGDGCYLLQGQVEGLPHCTNCALLAQTLGRLRQNLAFSEQESQKLVQHPPPLAGPICALPTPRSVDPVSSARRAPLAAAKEPQSICAKVMQQGKHVRRSRTVPDCSLPPQRLKDSPSASRLPPPQYTRPPASGDHEKTVPREVFDRPLVQEITNCCRHQTNTSIQFTTEPAQMDTTDQHRQLHRTELYIPNEQSNATLKSRETIAIRGWALQNQEQRRLSNHTDERDWMA